MTIDTTNMCSHLQKKLFEPDGVYYPIWQAMKDDETLTAIVRSRQLHIYRNGKKILVLAGKAQPKIIREDKLNELIIIKNDVYEFSRNIFRNRHDGADSENRLPPPTLIAALKDSLPKTSWQRIADM